ncbi:aldehyde dehydrogenase family protein [Phaeobacter gallaeciensis]|uniref:aldehyde dehydrogenase family protein n=1 Tax=Phaeobacter gallaeciensis TaxID=60890 RepID=UPI00237F00D4|nr:aldehyde dehydrogenase family protein [Phaeobacter gallaeciensis]MDE4190536.1 aldehyde dehydrogenase family protein [Phaeobacter gallaeciensis]MDE4197971.1 aldehyde dehydrogenase family protein [Phaeobacter gallaeciensis]MDE4202113.1 aldehyde dehydrogenase family protein [Phaeobacter gallaeciensis]MDE4206587.1 aldehyde dehydrogenase family protein [Phaeobacter gallaeciensis]MDE4214955.1 aldehyde dehydrogenase family protein [Phaeobacter gallaeciensis]
MAPQKLFLEGSWQAGSGTPCEVTSPIDGSVLTTLEGASAADVERAVAAARAAFEDGRWSRLAPAARKKVLHKIADRIEAEALPLAVLGVRDNGTEMGMALKAEPGSAAGTFRYYAEALDKIAGEVAPTAPDVLGLVQRAPVGVVGAIVPWNFPLMIGAWKLAPALAMGNSVVLKPAETASLSLLRLAEICAECGLPDGVLNVVTGAGAETGAALAESMGVDVLAFTGSGATGRKLLEASARSNLKRCYLELGGKSPNIVFADAPDLRHAAKVSAAGIFRNSGQVCVAGSRLLVEASVHDEFVAMLINEAEALRVGDPLDLGNHIGAVNSEDQLRRNLSFMDMARAEGGQVVTGGNRILQESGGTYMAPTIVTHVARDHALFQREVFGPVLSVTRFETEEQALALGNGTDFGLAAGVWTANLSRAHRMVAGIRAGVVHVNTYGGADNTVPLGGVGQSGNGHDKSLHALDKYVDLKTAWIQL